MKRSKNPSQIEGAEDGFAVCGCSVIGRSCHTLAMGYSVRVIQKTPLFLVKKWGFLANQLLRNIPFWSFYLGESCQSVKFCIVHSPTRKRRSIEVPYGSRISLGALTVRDFLRSGRLLMARHTGGYIKFFRKIDSDELFDDVVTFAIWGRLLLWARRKTTRVRRINGQVITLERGQVLLSAETLGRRLTIGRHKVGRKRVERALKELAKEQSITLERDNGGTIVTIVNYGRYQESENPTGQ